jgi:hypothetical protein
MEYLGKKDTQKKKTIKKQKKRINTTMTDDQVTESVYGTERMSAEDVEVYQTAVNAIRQEIALLERRKAVYPKKKYAGLRNHALSRLRYAEHRLSVALGKTSTPFTMRFTVRVVRDNEEEPLT